ncbi:MAG TPA: hypothetical protein VFQ53_25125 [Kofleriaceae bacterium]|nr:hypothetical protein [Kofleriaceae bacterium]
MRAAVIACAIVIASARAAAAYPIFQFSSGSDRCEACHFAPDGGGLLNDFGRTEAGDTISWRGGDGRFLHGTWTPPDAIALGGDFRAAGAGIARSEDDPQVLAFPMQADLYARIAAGPISVHVTGGLNGAARSRPDGAGPEAYVVSREHYVMYQRAPGELYVRAGRFFPVLGLRSADHTALARRALDFYNLEEPYALGIGTSGGSWDFHASAFVPNPFPSTAAGAQAYGATAYYEWFGDASAIGGQARYAQTADDKRILVGATAKHWMPGPRLLWLAELDLQRQQITDADLARLQLLGYAGVTRVMLPGLAIGVAAQRWDPDVLLGGSSRNTGELNVQLFPWAHFELHLLGRVGLVGGRAGSPDSLALLQIHYYP